MYGEDCWPVTWEKVWNNVDVFCLAHFMGWVMKAILVRHYMILWTISIMWEVGWAPATRPLTPFARCERAVVTLALIIH